MESDVTDGRTTLVVKSLSQLKTKLIIIGLILNSSSSLQKHKLLLCMFHFISPHKNLQNCKHNISNQCIHYLKKYKSDSDTNICICCYCFNCSTSKERQKSTTDYCSTGGGRLMTENVTSNGHAPKQINQSRQRGK